MLCVYALLSWGIRVGLVDEGAVCRISYVVVDVKTLSKEKVWMASLNYSLNAGRSLSRRKDLVTVFAFTPLRVATRIRPTSSLAQTTLDNEPVPEPLGFILAAICTVDTPDILTELLPRLL